MVKSRSAQANSEALNTATYAIVQKFFCEKKFARTKLENQKI